ncbi:MAG: phosphopantothenoylcysteine decarboxylase [Candidatus Omnitrophica bacterium]|nr:phosphopantothenoylcysteine decarboxylase [Candidatus Omnitrophota bacterium]MCM8815956.1 phosphopantothenoylcysteine decarboxylase [Candidatus Omnitrophota bacterium]
MKILITAGPTREYLDPVRFISNPATGITGYLIARIAKRKGHDVVLISGPSFLKPPKGVRVIYTESAIEMKDAVEKEFLACDVLIMSAAVSDWRPEKKFDNKLKIKRKWTLSLVPNPDILKAVSMLKRKNQMIVGFALESQELLKNAIKKMKDKNLDMIVANTVQNFGIPEKKSDIYVIYRDETIKDCSSFTKMELASFIVKEIERLAKKHNEK